MKKLLGILVLSLLLSSNADAGKTKGLLGGLMHGQWKPAVNMGGGMWMVEGRPFQAAMKGSMEHCRDIGKNFQFVQAITADVRYPNIIFMCN